MIDRRTPVIEAAWCDNADTVKALVEAGADLSLRDMDGDSALDIAEREGKKKVVSVITG